MTLEQPTAVLIDDEPLLSTHLAEKLARVWPELRVLGSAVNGRQALALIADTQPDVVFLDIHMPGLSGLDVAAELGANTRVVFVTAYDQYAVQAFERAAVDYLLKPVDDARLRATVERLKALDARPHHELETLLKQLRGGATHYLRWLRVGLEEVTELIAVDEVVYFQADRKYTSAFTAEREYLIRTPIKELEQQLDPECFWRIHRGTIVRVDEVLSATRDLRGRYALKLRSRSEVLRTSQAYGHLFKQM